MTDWKNRIVGHGSKKASEFLANPHNYRTHPMAQRRAVRASLDDLGWIHVVLENRISGNLIDGHERVWNALKNDDAEVPYIQVELTEAEEAQALLSLDPMAAMAGVDTEKMEELFRQIETDSEDLLEFLDGLADDHGLEFGDNGEQADDPGAEIDRAEELREKWDVKTGGLWKLGQHRLICGDCTDAGVVERVMDGEKAGAVVTDPPYGTNQKGVPGDEPENHVELLNKSVSCLPIENGVVIAFQSPRLFIHWLDAIQKNGYVFERMLWMYKEAQMTFPWRGWLLKSEAILISSVGKPLWNDVHPYSHDVYKMSELSNELPENSGWHG